MEKTRDKPSVKLVGLVVLVLILLVPLVAYSQASVHWLRIITTSVPNGVMKLYALTLDPSGDVNIVYRDKTLSSTITYPYFNLIIMDGGNGAIIGGYTYPYYFQNNTAGEPTAITVNGTLVYVTTNGGFLAVIDKNQLTLPKTWGVSIGGSLTTIADVKVVGSNIYLLVNDRKYATLYAIILDKNFNYVKGFGWNISGSTLKGEYLDIKSNWMIISAVDSNNNAIVIVHDLNAVLKDRYFNLTTSSTLKKSSGNTFTAIYDDITGLIYAVVPLTDTSLGVPTSSAIVTIDPSKGTINGSALLSYTGNVIQLNHAEAMPNGYIYATGTYTVGKGYPDLLLVELDYNPATDPPFTVAGGWKIHGDYEEYTNNSHQTVMGEYVYIGGFTNSFSNNSNFSTLVALMSPSLQVDKDCYAWNKTAPSYSSPAVGAQVNSTLINVGAYSYVATTSPVSDVVVPTVTIASDSLSYVNPYTPQSAVGIATSTPAPIPEPLYVAAVLLIGLMISYILWFKKK